MSEGLRPPTRFRRTAARGAILTASLAAAVAFAQPTWVFDPEGVYPERQQGASGVAYVEATRFPAGATQDETGLFVVCDALAIDAYDLFLWAGPVPDAAVDAAGTVEVLTRRGDDAARSARWSVEPDPVGQVLVANAAVRALLIDDLRRGGSLAVRVLTDPAAGAAQPTFVYEVGGFPEVDLDCAARVAAANDPFAGAPIVPVEPDSDDPFADAPVAPVDPFADAPPAPVDPFADAPPAPVDPAPPAAGDGVDDPSVTDPFLTDPTTGLLSFFGTIDEFEPLPPRLDLLLLDAQATQAIAFANPDGVVSAIGAFCNPDGGGDNGVLLELASPAFATFGEGATLVLYADRNEVGFVELGVFRTDAGVTGYVRYDKDELGVLRAIDAFPTLEAVLVGSGDLAEAYWSFETADLAAAVAALDCAP